METLRILSTNYSGQTADITFSAATGGTEVISGITIPYDFTDDFVFGDYSVFFTAYGNTCPLNVPVPSPVLSQTGATQYENVVLSASSILDGADYIWTLTDFYNTGDTQVSSYTGQTLIEGYFTSTGNTNVRLDVVLGSATATTTDFVVEAYSPENISGLIYWIDPSNESSVSYRTALGEDYVESIDNLASTPFTGQSNSIAVEQPYYITSTGMTKGLKTIMVTGFRNSYVGNMIDTSAVVSGDTFSMFRVGYHGQSSGYTAFRKIGMSTSNLKDNRLELNEMGPDPSTTDNIRFRTKTTGTLYNNFDSVDDWWFDNYNNSGLTYGFTYSSSGGNLTYDILNVYADGELVYNDPGFPTTTIPAANFPDGTTTYFSDHAIFAGSSPQYWNGYEELGEWVVYDRVLTTDEIQEINNYLKRKWGA